MFTKCSVVVLMVTILVISCCGSVIAATQRGFSAVTVRSTYVGADGSSWGRQQLWHFDFTNVHNVQVYSAGSDMPLLLLNYAADARLQMVVAYNDNMHSRKIARSADSVVLTHGFPVPYDDLIHPGSGVQLNVTDRRNVAGMIIAVSYTLATAPARDISAYVDVAIRGQVDLAGLYWIELNDSDGNLIVRQLWCPSLGWWLYEETGQRRSWLSGLTRSGGGA